MSSGSDRLAELLHEREIRAILSSGCRAIDRLDAELWRSMWNPGAVLEDEVNDWHGEAGDFADQLTVAFQPWSVHSHQINSTRTVIDGDSAHSTSYVTAALRGPLRHDDKAVDDHYRARYIDTWSRRDGRWRLDGRRVIIDSAWRQEVGGTRIGKWTRRDESDPSYAHLSSLPEPNEGTLEVLTAERAIRRQLHNYCRAVDRFDVPLWRGVWHDDGTLDYGDVQERGRAADMAEHMTLDHYPWASHSHQSTMTRIIVQDDAAVSETYSTNLLFGRLTEDGRLVDSHYRGRYQDRWSRRDGVWRIDHRRSISDLGWDQETVDGAVGLRSRRDRMDLSHGLFASLAD